MTEPPAVGDRRLDQSRLSNTHGAVWPEEVRPCVAYLLRVGMPNSVVSFGVVPVYRARERARAVALLLARGQARGVRLLSLLVPSAGTTCRWLHYLNQDHGQCGDTLVHAGDGRESLA